MVAFPDGGDPVHPFEEARLGEVPMRRLGLRIEGTPLAAVLDEFAAELAAAGIVKVKPRFYLSTEWGVPFETVAVAIPFYLARVDLAELHAERAGMVEGESAQEILRYLRHEMGHVVNYAYELYDREDWVESFGAMSQPYVEQYRPEPWSPRFVRHLPGWYAQKHPDEDWAETFAVWMTPGLDWRAEYRAWPLALAKLELCDRIMAEIADVDPSVTDDELDEDIGEIEYSIEDFYRTSLPAPPALPPGLDGALRAIFAEPAREGAPAAESRPAAAVVAAHARAVSRSVFTWTGHFPEHTHALLRHIADRATSLGLVCPAGEETRVLLELAVFVASLAMTHVHRGNYAP
jgi:hypothetical protein